MRIRHALLLSAIGIAACGVDQSDALNTGYGRSGTSSGSEGPGSTTTTTSTSSGSSGGTGTGSSSGATVVADDAGSIVTLADGGTTNTEALFNALLPTFQSTCGNACHAMGTDQAPTYLGGADPYVTIKAFPGVIVANAAQSILLTKGAHEGPNLVDPLRTSISNWLTAEAANVAAAGPPMTAPLAVATGSNTVSLASLGVAGSSITFSASLTGNILTLSTITLTAPAATAIHATFPIFYVNPTGGAAQIEDDDFSNVDQTVPEATSATLGTGILPITGWAAGDTLQISFEKFAAATAVDAGSGGGCKSVATFTSQAVPAIQANTCLNCHNTGGSGNASLDLSALALATPNDAVACAQALSRINTTTPAQSDIILAPTGQVANHPFTSATAAYVTAMETWIAAEK